MGFLKSLFSKKQSARPEDYQSIFLKWDRDGKKYGPLGFDDLILREWSNPPRWGRFENEEKWRDYGYFLDTLNRLQASQEQIAFLKEQRIKIDEVTLTFREALQLSERRQEELREIRAAECEENEKLPATKYIRKKMDSYGIDYPENLTRAQAKRLLAAYEDEQHLRELVKRLGKWGVSVPETVLTMRDNESAGDGISILDHLEHLTDLLQDLNKLSVEYSTPSDISLHSLSAFNSKAESALEEADDAEFQIKDRELFIRDDEYRVVGRLPKKQMDAIKKEVIEKTLQGRWNFERDIEGCIKSHLPDVRLEVVDY